MKAIFFLTIFLSFNCSIFSIEISYEDQIVLEKFFRTLFENSECGYVFFNRKPLCTDGFWIEDPTFPDIEFHERNVYLKEGAYVWQKLNFPLNTHYPLIIANSLNDYDENINDIHFINQDLLLKSINDQIALFKYALGPDVMADQILLELLNSTKNLDQLFKRDNALIGIILGFGTQNSLIGGRMEQLINQFSSAETPPLKPLAELFADDPALRKTPYLSNKKYFLFADSKKPPQKHELTPSLGYDSILQEYLALSEKLTASSKKLDTEKPWFVFSRLKNDPESEKLVKGLEITQSKIQKLLRSEDFFLNILQTIVSDKITFQLSKSPPILSLAPDEISALPSIIAEDIIRLTSGEDEQYWQSFLKGLKDAENNKTPPSYDRKTLSKLFYDNKYAKNMKKARGNLQQCSQLFEKLEDGCYHSVLPKKLYYKITREGRGSELKTEKKVLVHLTITSGSEDTLLFDSRSSGIPKELDLDSCITGFLHGILGMRVGEEREIYIHPSCAYGLFTRLEKGEYLKASVKLLKIYTDENFETIPPLKAIGFEQEFPDDLEKNYKVSQHKTGYYRGFQTWRHYKKCNLYSFQQVLTELERLKEGKSLRIPFSIDAIRVINRLHWNIYCDRH